MHDLTSPLLPRRVVSGLTGLSPAMLRRWDALGLLSRAGRRRPRLYSWREVERLQRAASLVKTRRVPLAQVRRLLTDSRSGLPRRGGVTPVAVPRSARRRGRRGEGFR
jgi:DNA-binding transcriptional MerR regulator